MADFKAAKVVAALPATLEADTVYFVRVGSGFDIKVTNGIGTIVALDLNTAAGVVMDNDPRLFNAREWSAATVTQAEAEAGTASTRRAWTAQRVRQAIAAWYLTVSTTFTRTLLGRSTAAQVRGDLGLGTAATMDVGTDSGNVMQVGAFGLGNDMVRILTAPVGHSNPTGMYYRNLEPGGSFFVDVRYFSETAGFRISNVPYSNVFYLHGAIGQGSLELRPPVRIIHTGNIQSTTGQSTQYPMTQKAVTDAINARGFEDASGVLTATSGALSNDMSAFLSLKTKSEIKAWLGIS